MRKQVSMMNIGQVLMTESVLIVGAQGSENGSNPNDFHLRFTVLRLQIVQRGLALAGRHGMRLQ